MPQFVTSVDLTWYELLRLKLQNLASAPSSPEEGWAYWDSTLHQPGFYNGTTWVYLGGSVSDEDVQDIVGAMFSGNTETGISIDYQDSDGTIDAVLDVEYIQDLVGAMFSGNTETGISVDYQDSDGTVDLVVSIDSTFITDFAEAVSDQVGSMVTGNTETGISVIYQDSDNTLDFVVGTLDTLPAPVGDVSLNSHKITSLADGTSTNDAVNFGQLNAIVNNQTWKDPVDAATTAALPAVTATTTTLTATSNGALAAQDGVTLAAGDSLLVKNQAAPAQNGIYTVTQVGTGGTPFILTRRSDADSAAELSDATVLIDAGTVGLGDIYTFPAIATLGTTDATPVKTGEGNTVYTADGSTIVLTGTQFGVPNGGITETQLNSSVAGGGLTGGGGSALAVNTGSGLEVSSDAVRIATGAAGAGLTGGGGSALAVGAGTGITVNADDVAVDTSVVARKYTALIGDGASTTITVTHGLGNQWALVQVVLVSTGAVVIPDIVLTSTTQCTITFATAPASNAYRVIVVA